MSKAVDGRFNYSIVPRAAATHKKRLKHGGNRQRLDLDKAEIALDTSDEHLILLDEALEKLAEEEQAAAELVKLRFFGGRSLREAAESLGMALRTAERQWASARARVYDRMRQDELP